MENEGKLLVTKKISYKLKDFKENKLLKDIKGHIYFLRADSNKRIDLASKTNEGLILFKLDDIKENKWVKCYFRNEELSKITFQELEITKEDEEEILKKVIEEEKNLLKTTLTFGSFKTEGLENKYLTSGATVKIYKKDREFLREVQRTIHTLFHEFEKEHFQIEALYGEDYKLLIHYEDNYTEKEFIDKVNKIYQNTINGRRDENPFKVFCNSCYKKSLIKKSNNYDNWILKGTSWYCSDECCKRKEK